MKVTQFALALTTLLLMPNAKAAESQKITLFNNSGVPQFIRKDSDMLKDGAKGFITIVGSKDVVEPGKRKDFLIENCRLNYTPVNHPDLPGATSMQQEFQLEMYEVPVEEKEKTITLPSSDIKEFTLQP